MTFRLLTIQIYKPTDTAAAWHVLSLLVKFWHLATCQCSSVTLVKQSKHMGCGGVMQPMVPHAVQAHVCTGHTALRFH